ncbi:MAG: hypothetical protein D6683_06815 [Actinomyces sp.]|nr:MAG: hypothetical protein D6683_06815 [Actinomyces sp.]
MPLLVAGLALLAASCSSVPLDELTGGRSPAPTTTTAPGARPGARTPPGPETLADLPGLLAVIDRDGLSVMSPAAVPHGHLDDDRVGGQPTWSRDGTRVAATFVTPVGIDGDDGDAPHALVLAEAPTAPTDGALDATVVDTATPWFFATWSPDACCLAVLGPGDTGTTLGLLDADGRALGPDTALEGRPEWIAWSPDGSRLAVRSSGELRLVAVDGRVGDPVGGAGPTDPTPLWLDDTHVLGHAPDGTATDRVRLVSVDVDTGVTSAVGDGLVVATPVAAALDPTRGLLALAHPETAGSTRPIAAPAMTSGAVVEIVDLATGERDRVADVPVVWLEWSPDGTHLLLGVPGPRGVRWDVVDRGGGRAEGPTLRPSGTEVRDHLPFFEQYAESPRRWSPDSRAFVVSGRFGSEDGVWVVRLPGSSRLLPTAASVPVGSVAAVQDRAPRSSLPDPVRVGDGRIAFWSPSAPPP